ncbi:MAG TPA: sigma-70 family RNA polymerase sigma factor [Caldilineaceae bacterium]|nr:sigma-70 family RNA polymerase sigma factor [Caldilineaceae bacterium]
MNELPWLVDQVKHGNVDAFARIVGHFQDMAVGYGYARLADWQLAEDAAQEAFFVAYLELDRLDDPQAFPGWFRQIVIKQIDRIRRKHKATVTIDRLVEVTSHLAEPSRLIEQQEVQTAIGDAIMTLPVRQREVVTLYYLGDYSQAEISVYLGVSLATVKMRLYHARQRLKTQLTTLLAETLPTYRPSRSRQFMEKMMSYSVQTKTVPPQQILSLTRQPFIRDLQAHLDGGVKTLTVYAQTLRAQITGLPTAIYHGPVGEDQHGPVEICLPVAGDLLPTLEIAVKEVPATQVAYTVATLRQSIYPGILKAHEAIEEWITNNGHQLAGAPWEVYLNFNQSIFSPTASLDDPCVEVAWPFL